jgi:hypothetical protein
VTWQLLREKLLGLATMTQQLIDYTENRDRGRDTTCMALDDAVAGLLDNQYKQIHVLSYSMGSLVVFDAVFAQRNSLKNEAPVERIASMTTIGCPLDLVRMFYPRYLEDRRERIASTDVPWINIFNAADVFGSNLSNGNDDAPRLADDRKRHDLMNSVQGALTADAVPTALNAKSVRYLNEDLKLWQIFTAKGFRVHSRYWGETDEAHCFEPFVQLLRDPALAGPPEVAVGVAAEQTGRESSVRAPSRRPAAAAVLNLLHLTSHLWLWLRPTVRVAGRGLR